MTRIRNLLPLIALIATAAPMAGQDSTANTAAYMELLRSDVQTEKVAVLTEALAMTDEQSQAFWPIYRAYQVKLAAIGDRRLKNIERFAANFTTMTDDVGADLAKEWFSQQQDRLSLLENTHRDVEMAIGGVLAARFVQVENSLNMLIDIQVASELPLIQ